jgi:hypothetical protein
MVLVLFSKQRPKCVKISIAGCGLELSINVFQAWRLSVERRPVKFDATGRPDVSLLPAGQEWVTHISQDLLPYWTTPVALGNPIGNFPTFRANDGSVIDPGNPPQEVKDIDRSETWLLNRIGRQYTRTSETILRLRERARRRHDPPIPVFGHNRQS